MEHRPSSVCRYAKLVKKHPIVPDADAGLERIGRFEEQLAHTRVGSRQRRALMEAIRLEADAYRKALDARQAAASLEHQRAKHAES